MSIAEMKINTDRELALLNQLVEMRKELDMNNLTEEEKEHINQIIQTENEMIDNCKQRRKLLDQMVVEKKE